MANDLQALANMVVLANATGNEGLFLKAVQDLLAGVRELRAPPAAATPDEIEGLRAHVALLKTALAQAERENDELRRAQPAAATPDLTDAEIDAIWTRPMPNGSTVAAFRRETARQFISAALAAPAAQAAPQATLQDPLMVAAQTPLSDLERAELLSLRELVNNPITADFVVGVQAEAAHQVQRWGDAHDRSKSAENWFWLVGYLAGKCLRACITGDRDKALHHTISAGAALANWHAAILADTSGTGVGVDADLTPLAESPQRRGE